jgi:hypothetical protein
MIDERAFVEKTNLEYLEEITRGAGDYDLNLILIGGNSVRAYTNETSWRFTKDLDFITVSGDLGHLYGMFNELGFSVVETDFGLKGSKKISDEYSIELHISVDKVIDWSTGETYFLPSDIFKKSQIVDIKASYVENNKVVVKAKSAPIEDIIIMKMMTERSRDHFDATAIILDSFSSVDLERFRDICSFNDLTDIIRLRISNLLGDIKTGVLRQLWEENTGLKLLPAREYELRKKLRKIENQLK